MSHKMFIDQMGREVTFPLPPQRIISLVPSQTEFLLDIKAPIIGRTKFCIHPNSKVKKIPVIGGTKNFRFGQIRKLQPDLIIGNKEENYREGITELQKDFPVWMSDIHTLEDAYEMMSLLGQIADLTSYAHPIISDCKAIMKSVRDTCAGKVVYLIWQNPWIAAGRKTFINSMLSHLGYENAVVSNRYPELSEEEITELKPDYIFLSTEPFPFNQAHLNLATNRWIDANCQLVDGELFSWYGSRLRKWEKINEDFHTKS
ncbi:MAG: helical backbone metal receptor [Bacteroidota bacterium]